MVSFPRVLLGASQAYKEQRDKISESSVQMRDFLRQGAAMPPSKSEPNVSILDEATRNIVAQFDRVNVARRARRSSPKQ